MCGIFGISVRSGVDVSVLFSGLKSLEYRGYDSCGLAFYDEVKVHVVRATGNVDGLLVAGHGVQDGLCYSGIGHTRWATHGAPSLRNAHPIVVDGVLVVHNGIIENYAELREEMIAEGVMFRTCTDTEVMPQMVAMELKKGLSPIEAINRCVSRWRGVFSALFMFENFGSMLIAIRCGLPLLFGYSHGGTVLASDASALPCDKAVAMLDGDIAVMIDGDVELFHAGCSVQRKYTILDNCMRNVTKEGYKYFMHKEIFEQPSVLDMCAEYFHVANSAMDEFIRKVIERGELTIIGCGSSYFAGLISKYWLESMAGIRIYLEIASEFLNCKIMKPSGIILFISQSGETADTLRALKLAKEANQCVVSLTNLRNNSMDSVADIALYASAGVEVGVASTKTFTAQLAIMAHVAVEIARRRTLITVEQSGIYFDKLRDLAGTVRSVLHDVRDSVVPFVNEILLYSKVLLMGRSLSYGVALEGALKIRELSYISAMGIAAGEMKHGSIALVDEQMPIIVVAPCDDVFPKIVSNIQEVAARSGRVMALTDAEGFAQISDRCSAVCVLPKVDTLVTPILYNIPLQMIAYLVAIEKGINVDQPRNLAKSVTVE